MLLVIIGISISLVLAYVIPLIIEYYNKNTRNHIISKDLTSSKLCNDENDNN